MIARLLYRADRDLAVLVIVLSMSSVAFGAERAEPRFVPTAGATLKYKTIMLRNIPDEETSTGGMITTSRVETSDGLIAKSDRHYLAYITDGNICKGDTQCIGKNEKYKNKDGLLEIPVPTGLSTTPVPNFREARYFLSIHAIETSLGGTPNKEGKIELVYGNTTEAHMTCDWALLTSFFPIGKAARISVPCSSTREIIAPPIGPGERRTPGKWEKPLTLSYEGRRSFTNASGTWDVHTVRMVVDEIFETELLFSEKIGAVVRLHSTSQLKTPNFINKQGITGTQIVEFITDVEMIKYEE